MKSNDDNQPYRKYVEYHFEVDGQQIAITRFTDEVVEVEEVRKNGQEDCHMYGVLRNVSGTWEWENESFSFYESDSFASLIAEYVNMHGVPID